MSESGEMKIGTVGNYYGGLWVCAEKGKFFWMIEGHGGDHWQEIPESLYRALVVYQEGKEDDKKPVSTEAEVDKFIATINKMDMEQLSALAAFTNRLLAHKRPATP